MLAQHRVQHAPRRRKEFIILHFPGVPLSVGGLKNRAQKIRERLIRTENPEIALILIQLGHVTQEGTENESILALDSARRRHRHRVDVEVRHAQVAQQSPTIGVRIGAHPSVALGGELGQFRNEAAIPVEQFFRLVAPHPGFKLLEMFGVLGIYQEWHLVGSEGALDLKTIDDLRPCPALGGP